MKTKVHVVKSYAASCLTAILVASIMVTSAVFAVDVIENETIALSADSSDDYAIASGVTLTLNVASGTSTMSGSISGDGAIAKTGEGSLVLAHEGGNTFSGGISLSKGNLTANTSGAFGEGAISASGSTIHFNATDGVFSNDFTLGSTSVCTPTFKKNTTLAGSITLMREHNFFQEDAAATVVFNGAIGGSRNLIYQSSAAANIAQFKGALTLNDLYAGSKWNQYGTLELYNPGNSFLGMVCLVQSKVVCKATNVVNGASLTLRSATGAGARFDLSGYDQTVTGVGFYYTSSATLPTASTTGCEITSDNPATLKITGTGANKTAPGFLAVNGKVTLEIDADSTFRQAFSNRTSATTGEIKVKSGILDIAGDSTFRNVGRATVSEAGTLEVNANLGLALSGMTNLVLSGTFSASTQPVTPSGPLTRSQPRWESST